MQLPPFDVIHCSWPRPVEQDGGRWMSEPEWNAPPMPFRPQPRWTSVSSEVCWLVDWRDWFKRGVTPWEQHLGGEMRGFHVVFHLRVNQGGRLIFWDDDGCIIRRNGQLVHTDRSAHMLTAHQIDVELGDCLEVAQWQHIGGWLWGGRIDSHDDLLADVLTTLRPYLGAIQECLARPHGPPLKLFCSGGTPVRLILSLYSMILNGYAPAQILLYGENQWNEQARQIISSLAPFARVVPMSEVLSHIGAAGGSRVVELARRYWYVMKTCVAMLVPPNEFCLMDDDVFILDRVDDALRRFDHHNLVFTPDTDHGRSYLNAWGRMTGRTGVLPTSTFNAGLYWMRNHQEPSTTAAQMLQVRPNAVPAHIWEQGFIACRFAQQPVVQLPTQRYFYPLFDGLPGGLLEYDYALNPCGFASIHFGGLAAKPSDLVSLRLAPAILARQAAVPPDLTPGPTLS